MPIPLDDRAPSIPSLKFGAVGSHAVIRLAHRTTKPMTDPVTKKPKFKDDGVTPRQELVVTGIYISGTGQRSEGQGDNEVLVDFEPGDLVRVFIAGHRWGSLIEAENKFGKLNVGDVMKITFKGTEKSSMKGGADKKLWSFSLRRSLAETEADEIRRAEDVYHQVKGGVGRPEQAQGPAMDDDDLPF